MYKYNITLGPNSKSSLGFGDSKQTNKLLGLKGFSICRLNLGKVNIKRVLHEETEIMLSQRDQLVNLTWDERNPVNKIRPTKNKL